MDGSPQGLTRRELLQRAGSVGTGVALGAAFGRVPQMLDAGGVAGPVLTTDAQQLPEPSWQRLPRWRGFNLDAKLDVNRNESQFEEQDFALIAALGFNFVRLPLDYRFWTESYDWRRLRPQVLTELDGVLRLAASYGLHVCLNFHRAPGHSVRQPPEPVSLWENDDALAICAGHWAHFALRYRGIPNRYLSFNLLNEPGRVDPAVHRRVITRLVEAVRHYDDRRLLICDGRDWGRTPPTELVGLGVAAATRGYEPFRLTHYRAEWEPGATEWSLPTYPLSDGDTVWNKETLRRRWIESWRALQAQGVGVFVGEWGAYNRTPHAVVLAWMRDCLELWQEAGWGWALWNWRGSFGPLDSGRTDVAYVPWGRFQVDRAMLELLVRG